MSKQLEFEFRPDGTIVGIYNDEVHELADNTGMTITKVGRASNVEWECNKEVVRGWTVRSASNFNVAIRRVKGRMEVTRFTGELVYFKTREEALEAEVKFFWWLLNGKATTGE